MNIQTTPKPASNRCNLSMPKWILSLAFAMILFSCNNKKKDDPANLSGGGGGGGGGATTMAVQNPTKFPWFKLNRQDILDIINRQPLKDSPLLYNKYKTIILKHALLGVTNDSALLKLIGYASKNHGLHGRTSKPFFIPDTSIRYKPLIDSMILGNNYMDWDAVAQLVFFTTGARKGQLLDDFKVIVFEPMAGNVAVLCAVCSGNLWYRIIVYDIHGNIKGGGGAGSGSTNPSPPADPTP